MGRPGDTELAAIAARRSGTWWLLSRLVIDAPTLALLDELEATLAAVDTTVGAVLAQESAALLVAVREVRGVPEPEVALGVDRTRLLGGVVHSNKLVAPYESAVLQQDMNSELVLDVTACYAEAGMDDLASQYGPPDYLGTELRFMALLAYREMQALQEGNPGLAGTWQERERRFLSQHIMAWVPTHCERLSAAARTPYHAALLALLAQACRVDQGDLEQARAWRPQGVMDVDPATEGVA